MIYYIGSRSVRLDIFTSLAYFASPQDETKYKDLYYTTCAISSANVGLWSVNIQRYYMGQLIEQLSSTQAFIDAC